jgi:hypothetical protein
MDSFALSFLWETEAILNVPESVINDFANNQLFVSNINGSPTEKNGKGYISLLSEEGKIINQYWLEGLDAPKGMGISGSFLYVTNITEVVKIDLQKASIIHRIPIDGSVFLNDISIDKEGLVYVSDMKQNKIHILIKDEPYLFIDNIPSANGLCATTDALYVLSGQELIKIDKDKSISKLSSGIQGGGDGLEQLNQSTFLASGWQGVLHLVSVSGNVKILLDTRILDSNIADIGYNKDKKIVYIPTFFTNKVVAYQLKQKLIFD